MPLSIEEKKSAIDELHKVAKEAVSAVAADYHGTSVAELTKLRKEARRSNIYLKVMRNTLAKRALSETKFSCFDQVLSGPTILAFSEGDLSSVAKLVYELSKVNTSFKIKGMSLGDSLLDLNKLSELANLPTREEALSIFMSTLKAPLTKFILILDQIPTNLVRKLEAVRESKQKADS